MAPESQNKEEPANDDVGRLLDAARSGEIDSLDELAAKAHFSRFHLSRLLKKHLGFPLRDFLAAARVERSIDGLVDGHNVTRSQVDAGHDSPSSFHRAFRRHTGMSPSDYRKQMATLAAHLMRQQDRDGPLVVLHRTFSPDEHAQLHPLTVEVEGAKPYSALFIALHPDPLVRGEPALGIAMLGTTSYDVSAIPDGRYYAMVVEVPRKSDVRAYFQMAKTVGSCSAPRSRSRSRNRRASASRCAPRSRRIRRSRLTYRGCSSKRPPGSSISR
ncbi:hypothetical protein BSZ39_10335 [Bowdeniella nasicola]|uniref:HTH araC/xylS-type domain-containing protein n=1 Tax=Bowdeniella nasicola TaxID=208480 RepID=A0A1Q5Q0N2_9ACTO|nr:helix-turn-helix domain-containing protein [Bowdeniella nasicola]OKL53275.1 hypothetical protein BSZ39_10335 [Bowdeniella nasicola]